MSFSSNVTFFHLISNGPDTRARSRENQARVSGPFDLGVHQVLQLVQTRFFGAVVVGGVPASLGVGFDRSADRRFPWPDGGSDAGEPRGGDAVSYMFVEERDHSRDGIYERGERTRISSDVLIGYGRVSSIAEQQYYRVRATSSESNIGVIIGECDKIKEPEMSNFFSMSS